jgi:hypothetical protein
MIGVSNPTHTKLIEEAGKRGAMALTTEFFCLEARADDRVKQRYTEMSKVCGFNLYDFYKKNSTTQGYLRLNYEIKRKFVEEMREACKKAGMGFLVSDAHHKEKCVLANGCRWGSCCGVPNDKYFGNYAKCQFTEAITIAKEKGEVRFTDITKNNHDYLKKTMVRSVLHSGDMADHFHKSLYDYMRWSWNHPAKSANSPYRYFSKILVPTGLDENGDVIYKFNQKKYDR